MWQHSYLYNQKTYQKCSSFFCFSSHSQHLHSFSTPIVYNLPLRHFNILLFCHSPCYCSDPCYILFLPLNSSHLFCPLIPLFKGVSSLLLLAVCPVSPLIPNPPSISQDASFGFIFVLFLTHTLFCLL